ncbi:MAG: class I SAM-dependent methyltransferase [Oscillospiraceae bacterium]|nr:class I SAM-dependent methyltransferase [Oscillospiraceae bacterium]
MKKNIGNYARHARFWDWSGQDRTEENEYWLKHAGKYGKNVLIPMCAWGETGAYMARRGFSVTAFDITPEMIAEGRKRFGDVPGLRLYEGDVTDFRFDIPPVDFCFSMDFEALDTIEDVKKAFGCIHHHLRVGGCLVIKPWCPPKETGSWPLETYWPQKQVYPGMKVWKTGSGHNDAQTRRRYISQTFYMEYEDGRVESFDNSFCAQCYTREEWLSALRLCGFEVVREHGGLRQKMSFSAGDTIEAIKIT